MAVLSVVASILLISSELTGVILCNRVVARDGDDSSSRIVSVLDRTRKTLQCLKTYPDDVPADLLDLGVLRAHIKSVLTPTRPPPTAMPSDSGTTIKPLELENTTSSCMIDLMEWISSKVGEAITTISEVKNHHEKSKRLTQEMEDRLLDMLEIIDSIRKHKLQQKQGSKGPIQFRDWIDALTHNLSLPGRKTVNMSAIQPASNSNLHIEMDKTLQHIRQDICHIEEATWKNIAVPTTSLRSLVQKVAIIAIAMQRSACIPVMEALSRKINNASLSSITEQLCGLMQQHSMRKVLAIRERFASACAIMGYFDIYSNVNIEAVFSLQQQTGCFQDGPSSVRSSGISASYTNSVMTYFGTIIRDYFDYPGVTKREAKSTFNAKFLDENESSWST